MRARLAVVAVTVVTVVSATEWSLVLADRGAAFSTALTVEGGTALLLVPTAVCLLASIGLAWRPPQRPRAAAAFAIAAVAWLAGEWDNPASGSALAFSAGLLLYAVTPVAVLLAGLSRSGAVLSSQTRAVLLGAGCAVTMGVQGLLTAIFLDPASGGCRGCARNLWLVSGDESIRASVDEWGIRIGVLWLVVTVAMLALVLARASPAVRRATGPTLLTTIAFEGVTLASYAHSWERGFLGGDDLDRRLWVAQSVVLSLVGVAALAELVRESRARRALARVVVDLSGVTASRRSLRDALAVRLSDPELVVAYPVDGARYVDAAARPVSIDARPGRQVTRLDHGGRELATLVHRSGALSGRDAASELVAAIRLGLEHEQLRARALAQVDDVRASGLRLVETGDAERRRLERDLHDGAQQRLVGLALGLRLLHARRGTSGDLAEAMHELTEAIDDLRSLARGLSPVLLTEAGLSAALRGLAESAPVRLGDLPSARFEPVIESTAYAIVERASTTGPVHVDVRHDGQRLVVELFSQGRSWELGDLDDRVTALGGQVQVADSALRVSLPT